MPRLIHKKNDNVIATCILTAKSFRERCIGLIGCKGLQTEEAFLITACPSIHTFFMKFPIDVIFTDKKFCIVSLFENVSAGKILFGGFKSRNVFEIKAGQIQFHRLKEGDILYVEH